MMVVDRSATIRSADERLRPTNSEVERLLSDPSRAKEILGWTVAVCLEEGIRRRRIGYAEGSGEMAERYLV